jgi:hypothetical protein
MVIANIRESSGLPEFTPWEESDISEDTVNQIVILPTGAGPRDGMARGLSPVY